jgi:hypothetical protein
MLRCAARAAALLAPRCTPRARDAALRRAASPLQPPPPHARGAHTHTPRNDVATRTTHAH